MRTLVLIPRRAGDEQRDRVWAWARNEWWPAIDHAVRERTGHGVEIHEGHHDVGEFNRSAAVNTAWRGARTADPVDVVVIADADTICGPHQVASAIEIAWATGRITFGHGRFAHLTRDGTDKIMAGWRGDWEPFIEWTSELTASSLVVLRSDLWHAVGGMDESFVGWGAEDVALSLAAQCLGGGHHRVAGTAWHLWHEPAPGTGDFNHPTWKRNHEVMLPPYLAARDDPAAMRALLAERHRGRLGTHEKAPAQ